MSYKTRSMHMLKVQLKTIDWIKNVAFQNVRSCIWAYIWSTYEESGAHCTGQNAGLHFHEIQSHWGQYVNTYDCLCTAQWFWRGRLRMKPGQKSPPWQEQRYGGGMSLGIFPPPGRKSLCCNTFKGSVLIAPGKNTSCPIFCRGLESGMTRKVYRFWCISLPTQ